MVLLMREYELETVRKPALVDQDTWDMFKLCLQESLYIVDFSTTATLVKLVWLHETHIAAVAAVHDEFPSPAEIPEQWHNALKLSAIHFPLIDALRALHGQ